MCREFYQYHRSCGGGEDGKLCVCDESCPYYEPYFSDFCNSGWENPDESTRGETCAHRIMDDRRDTKGAIMPTAACHNCPGHKGHMKGGDLPKPDLNHPSAKAKRKAISKEQFEHNMSQMPPIQMVTKKRRGCA